MNMTNLFGTITAILTAVYGFLMSIGCSPGQADFAATCSISWLPPTWVPIVAGVFGAITFALKIFRPGGVTKSLFGSTAVVTKDAGVGAVTPEQVAER